MHWQRLLLSILLWVSVGRGQRLQPSEDFPNYEELESYQGYQLFWKIDGANIIMEIHAMTFGWVGIGISPDGSMYGSDIYVGGVANGEPYGHDRIATGYVMPTVDASQDVELLRSVEQGRHTIIKIRRPLVAQDSQDRTIQMGVVHVVWAYHPQDAVGDSIRRHTRKGSRRLVLRVARPRATTPPPLGPPSPTQNYPNSVQMSSSYMLYWAVSGDLVTFEAIVRTTGWIAFGISPRGAMVGSDIFTGWVTNTQLVKSQDRFASQRAQPTIDQPNWQVLGAWEINGYTQFKVQRNIKAVEANVDVDINTGPIWLCWAFGTTEPTSGDSIQQHSNRGVRQAVILIATLPPTPPPVPGTWSEWTGPAACSATCGGQTLVRRRQCSPSRATCVGSETERIACDTFIPCPVAATWSSWYEGTCSVTCGTGTQTQTRQCLPLTATCGGPTTRQAACETNQACPDPCGDWEEWGPCSVSCGSGQRTRNQMICTDAQESEPCFQPSCMPPALQLVDCSFEMPCDSMLQEFVTDHFDWLERKGYTRSGRTGPEFDHTFKNRSGVYMYMEASKPNKQGDSAILKTKYFRVTSESVCLSFWYHMYGANMGELNVYITQNGNQSTVWREDENKGRNWHEARLSIGITGASEFSISFEGIVGSGYKGDIAIDDVRLETEKCSDIVGTQESEEWNEWGSWSPCTVTCGAGIRSRTRDCKSRNCQGKPTELQICEPRLCQSSWDIWGDWGSCTYSCGTGVRVRYRRCMSFNCPPGGRSMERSSCEMGPC